MSKHVDFKILKRSFGRNLKYNQKPSIPHSSPFTHSVHGQHVHVDHVLAELAEVAVLQERLNRRAHADVVDQDSDVEAFEESSDAVVDVGRFEVNLEYLRFDAVLDFC